MAEDVFVTEMVLPGTYIRVLSEGLVGVGGVATGNIGIVGLSTKDGSHDTEILSDFSSAMAAYSLDGEPKTPFLRALEMLFATGATTVFARGMPSIAITDQENPFTAAFEELLKENVNILIAPELSTANAISVLDAAITTAETNRKDVIGVAGADGANAAAIRAQVAYSKRGRLILAAPAIKIGPQFETTLAGGMTAAAVAGLLAGLGPQVSPTNKVAPGLVKLAQRFRYGETMDLVSHGVLVLEERGGVRVVRGVTTDMNPGGNTEWGQITTRRITNYVKAGIRQAADPFIGRLNNERVRKAMQGAIDGFLTRMVQEEALIGYKLNVWADRPAQIAGRAYVDCLLQPTFSIDFVAVTLILG